MDDDRASARNDDRAAPPGTVELTEFTVSVERAAEILGEAGFPRTPDHVGRWCRQGRLRATKQETRNRLSRYLIDRRSLDGLIARLRAERDAHERPSVYEATAAPRHDDDSGDAAAMSPRPHGDIEDVGVSPSRSRLPSSWGEGEMEAAELRGELRALKEQVRREAARAERLERENGGLRVALGEAKGKLEFAQGRLRLLEGPRPAAPVGSPGGDGGTPTSRRQRWWWWR